LFHQAGSNAAEYDPIAPRLVSLGYECLAVDQRSGGQMWERDNRTVTALGASTGYLDAYPDLQAALAWAGEKNPGVPIVAIGSSYTASLVLRLAAENPKIAAIASFSPGEYMGAGSIVAGWASEVTTPTFITSAGGRELSGAQALYTAVATDQKVHHVPATAVHGASALRPDRNGAGVGQMWAALEAFLARYAPAASASVE
jgi:dienelactone hydrolase